MDEKIVNVCQMIEKKYRCKILFAVESGSRLWRFDSQDSDYDIRFVFVYTNKRKYLDFVTYKNVIEYVDKEAKIDMVGFDIKKYSQMVLKSNPNMIDWTFSDILYYGEDKNRHTYKRFLVGDFNPRTVVQAYRGIAMNALKDIENGKKTIKKYLYALRGFLSADWVVQHCTLPDLNFCSLIDKTDIHNSLKVEIDILIKLKRMNTENHPIDNLKKIELYLQASKELVKSRTNLPPARKYTVEHHNLMYYQMVDFWDLYWIKQ